MVAGEHLSPVASLPEPLGLGNCFGREDLFPGLAELDRLREIVPVQIDVMPYGIVPDLLAGRWILVLEGSSKPDDDLLEPTDSVFEVVGVEDEVGGVEVTAAHWYSAPLGDGA